MHPSAMETVWQRMEHLRFLGIPTTVRADNITRHIGHTIHAKIVIVSHRDSS